jgi:hypothetical protein
MKATERIVGELHGKRGMQIDASSIFRHSLQKRNNSKLSVTELLMSTDNMVFKPSLYMERTTGSFYAVRF